MSLLHLPLVISENSPSAVQTTAQQLLAEIESYDDNRMLDICCQRLAQGHGPHRSAVVADNKAGFMTGLAALAKGRDGRNTVTGVATSAQLPVLVFPGQGQLWGQMTGKLMAASPYYREQLGGYSAAFARRLNWDLTELIFSGEVATQARAILPVQFSIASALADMWRKFGLQEAAVVGHSIGEVGAAHAAGYLSRDKATDLLVLWGEALSLIEGNGAMASVAATEEQLRPMLIDWPGQLEIAAINSTRNLAVSGDISSVESLIEHLEAAAIWAWKIGGAAVAGHTQQVDVLKSKLLEYVTEIPSDPPRSKFYSSVTGTSLEVADLTSEYWFRTLRQTVLFRQSIQKLINDGHRMFVELSPNPLLTTVIQETMRESGVSGCVIPTLDRRRGDVPSFMYSLSMAYVNGLSVDWPEIIRTFWPEADSAITAVSQRRTDSQGQSAPSGPNQAAPVSQSAPQADEELAPGADVLDVTALANKPEYEQRDILLGLLSQELKNLIGETFDTKTAPFQSVGLTSLSVVELAKALADLTGLDLPTTLIYDYSTPEKLVEYLRAELGLINSEGSAQEDALAQGSKRRIDQAEDPIAIVGMACRYPGGISSPEDLWEMVLKGESGISEYPSDRGWDTDLYDPEAGKPGKIAMPKGGFLHQAAYFDPGFFGISPREALTMEPQQRLLLEVTWEALERAGIDPTGLRGSDTGVFAGIMGMEYGSPMAIASEEVAGLAYMGTAACVAAGRVSYTLGLEGPTLSIDTACSSSLVAIHTACEALRNGDCSLAVAGGVTVMPTPGILIDFSKQQVLAPDGYTKAFAESANGVALGEGIGMVALERLSQAKANGHRVLATIKGSAVNHDGASNGLTAPSGTAQQRLIRYTLAGANLSSKDVDIIEGHGTGTRLGDPIEASALLATYGQGRDKQQPIFLGSIKSNIGHAQAAAGVAGVIKMTMAMDKGLMPQSLNIDAPSSEIAWKSGAIELLAQSRPWPAADRPRRAAISSFGVSGTNSHMIIEQASITPDSVEQSPSNLPSELVLPLSARTETALRAVASRLREYMATTTSLNVMDLCYSQGIVRSNLPVRAAICGASQEQLRKALNAFIDGQDDGAPQNQVPADGPRLVLVFPGQGAQWPGMGMDLYEAFSVYRSALNEADACLRPFTQWSVVDVLRDTAGAPPLETPDVVQPATFAVMVAIARLWLSFGLKPDAVMGHSQGEVVAAHIAGVLSLEDAAKIVALRSKILLSQSGTGGMAMIALPEAKLQELLTACNSPVTMAVFNSPTSTVVAGDTDAIDSLLKHCKKERVRSVRIKVDVPGHTHQLEVLRPALLEQLLINPQAAKIPFYSTVQGYSDSTPMDGTQLGAEYWADNLCRPVRFDQAVQQQVSQSQVTFLDCSANSVLLPAIEETAAGAGVAIGSMSSKKSLTRCIRDALGQLFIQGHNPNWRAVYPAAKLVVVPTYPFEHKHLWLKAQAGNRQGGAHLNAHGLLSSVTDLPNNQGLLLMGSLSLETHPWLADHAAGRVVLLPGTAYLDMLSYGGRAIGCSYIEELTLQAPMVVPEKGGLDLLVSVGAADSNSRRQASVYARSQDNDEQSDWDLHASAQMTEMPPSALTGELPNWPPTDAEVIDLQDLRNRLTQAGYDYGPAFKGLSAAWQQGDSIWVEAQLPETLTPQGYGIHPALIDTLLHPIALAEEDDTGLRLPFAFNGVAIAPGQPRSLRAKLRRSGNGQVDILAIDDDGQPALVVSALHLRKTNSNSLRQLVGVKPDQDLLKLSWTPLPASSGAVKDGVAHSVMWAVLDQNDVITSTLNGIAKHTSFAGLAEAAKGANAAPEVIIWALPSLADLIGTDAALRIKQLCEQVVENLQAWLAQESLYRTRIVTVTQNAIAVGNHEQADLALGTVWGLLRSAQSEYPDRLTLVDVDQPCDSALYTRILASECPQLLVRDSQLFVPHLQRTVTDQGLVPAAETRHWRLDLATGADLEKRRLADCPELERPLNEGEIRIEVRAAGVNFYDLASTLGLIEQEHELGSEAAGVVIDVGPGVNGFAVDDRVMAITEGAFSSSVIVEQRRAAKMPESWSFARAAGVPVVFLTVYHALVHIGKLRPGEKILIHAAAGGIGQAAIQLARYCGAELFVTAHPNKWQVLRDLGIDDDHIASSRDLEFVSQFRQVLGGGGIDLVLNSLTGEFIDGSMSLMGAGGRFIELGKTDIRDPEAVNVQYPALSYHFIRRPDEDSDHVAKLFSALLPLFADNSLAPVPISAYGMRNAPAALRLMQQGRHTGKIVLTVPEPLGGEGTVMITGGTGALGSLLARHLVKECGARHLLLVSRSGLKAAGASQLQQDLEAEVASVTVAACDLSDFGAVQRLLETIPPEQPLAAVYHTAGILANATVANLTPEEFAPVFSSKVDTAWNLHLLTKHLDLKAFVLYSSPAATFGNPGQGNYAAANAFLDVLAQQRYRQGLPATAMGWGLWQVSAGTSGALTDTDVARVLRTGMALMPPEHGLAMLDAAVTLPYGVLSATPFNLQVLRKNAQQGILHPYLQRLVSAQVSRQGQGAEGFNRDLRKELSALEPSARSNHLRTLIEGFVCTVLGLDDQAQIPADQPFSDSGLDSLMALELRNRLSRATGLQLTATVIFDFPTPEVLTSYLGDQLFPDAEEVESTGDNDAQIRELISSIDVSSLRQAGLLDTLLALANTTSEPVEEPNPNGKHILTANADELIQLAMASAEETP